MSSTNNLIKTIHDWSTAGPPDDTRGLSITWLRRFWLLVSVLGLVLLGFVEVAPAEAAGAAVSMSAKPSESIAYTGEVVTYAATLAPQSGTDAPTGSVTFTISSIDHATVSHVLCTASLASSGSDATGSCSATTASSIVGNDTVKASYAGDSTFAATSTTFGMPFLRYSISKLLLPPFEMPSKPAVASRAADPSWTPATGSVGNGGTAGIFVTSGSGGQIDEYGASFGPNGSDPVETSGIHPAMTAGTAGNGSPSVRPYSTSGTNGFVLAFSQIIHSYYCVSFAFFDGTYSPNASDEFTSSAAAPSVCAIKGSYPFSSTGPSTSLLDPYLFTDQQGVTWLIFSQQWSGGTCTAVQCSQLVAQRISYSTAGSVSLVGSPELLVTYDGMEKALNADNPSSANADKYQYGDHPLIENPAVVSTTSGSYDLVFSIGTWCGAKTKSICNSTNGCGSTSGTDCYPITYNTAETTCTISEPNWSCNSTANSTGAPTLMMESTGGTSFLSDQMSPTTVAVWAQWVTTGKPPYPREAFVSPVSYSP